MVEHKKKGGRHGYISKIIKTLCKNDYSILELANELDVAYNNLLKKLELLEEQKIIIRDESQRGRVVIIKLNPTYSDVAKYVPGSLKEFLDNLQKGSKNYSLVKKLKEEVKWERVYIAKQKLV